MDKQETDRRFALMMIQEVIAEHRRRQLRRLRYGLPISGAMGFCYGVLWVACWGDRDPMIALALLGVLYAGRLFIR